MKFLTKNSVIACFSVLLSMAGFQALAEDMSQHMSQHKHQDAAVMAANTMSHNSASHDAMSDKTMSQESHSHAMNHSAQAMKVMAAEIVTTGIIKGVLAESGQLKIQHQAIPEWSMGAMQMKFKLASDLSAADFSEGQQIKFRLHQENMMKYTITEILDK